MRSDWSFVKIGDVCPFVYGKSLPARSRVQGEFPVVSSAGIIDTHNSYCVEGPGIVIGRKGTVGSLYYLNNNFWPIDTAFYVASEPSKYNLRYVYYMLHTLGLPKMNFDAAVPGLNRSSVHRLEIPFPPLPEQRRIAALLGALDDKIELNRKMNQTLEEMAQAIFKSWFIDFDGVPEEDLVESELGLIPRGWEVGTFGQIAEVLRTNVKPHDQKEVEFSHFSLPAFDSGELPSFELGADIKSNKLKVYNDSFLLSKLNPRIPRIWLPNLANIKNPICSTEFLVIRSKDIYPVQYLYSLAKSHTFYFQLLGRVAGTTGSHQRVKSKDILSIKVTKPTEDLVRKYQNVTSYFYDQIHNNIQQSQTLAELRDTLLPKLISGELRIPEAEEQVTDALS